MDIFAFIEKKRHLQRSFTNEKLEINVPIKQTGYRKAGGMRNAAMLCVLSEGSGIAK